MKAFVINVVGDVGLVLAAILIFRELGSFDYRRCSTQAPRHFDDQRVDAIVAICLLLLVGAFAKSAQLPLHTWLPDAMEGPTPVSALIHAATMVTAGVYLIARIHPLFELAPTAADIAAFIGAGDAARRGAIALVVTDLKRIIAYSTMSQIGYMVIGVSIGAYSAGLFHLMTHAFFKALLFMAAGSVIAAMANRQNIDRMGGFRRAMPFTSATLLIGALALAAFPGSSGFFSKDEILAFAAERGGIYWIFAVGGYVGALITAVLLVPARLPGLRRRAERRGARARAAATSSTPSRSTRRPASPRTPTSASPGPSTTSPSASGPMKFAMGVLGVPGPGRRPGPDPGRRRRHRQLPRAAASRTRRSPTSSVPTDRMRSGLVVGARDLAGRHRLRLAPLRARGRASPRCSTSGSAPCTRFLVNKWYFDELNDALVVRPALGARPLRQPTVRARRRPGLVSGTVGRRARRRRRRARRPSRASCAPTRCCWSPASPASPSTSWSSSS